ncbi:MAG: class I SAM-dependent methyltransferase [Candidatus Yanofskybacteria bacterium]|nr:class I SAM-dependent methyltransferase [Candidatus Yanofskybacteria bacterium]
MLSYLKILDLGIRSRPWLFDITSLERRAEATKVLDGWRESGFDLIKFRDNTAQYIGVELNWKKTYARNLSRYSSCICAVNADGQHLPFANDTFNLVILSEIMSIPSCSSHCEKGFLPISDREKLNILNEAIRTLKTSGLLITSDVQTAQFGEVGYNRLRDLHRQGALQLRYIDPNFHRGVFEKMPVGHSSNNLDILNRWWPESAGDADVFC